MRASIYIQIGPHRVQDQRTSATVTRAVPARFSTSSSTDFLSYHTWATVSYYSLRSSSGLDPPSLSSLPSPQPILIPPCQLQSPSPISAPCLTRRPWLGPRVAHRPAPGPGKVQQRQRRRRRQAAAGGTLGAASALRVLPSSFPDPSPRFVNYIFPPEKPELIQPSFFSACSLACRLPSSSDRLGGRVSRRHEAPTLQPV